MSVPPAPPPLEDLGCMPFAFDPAIGGIEPNEWRYRGCTWAEVLLVNAHSGQQISVPRQFVGPVSSLDECGVVVSLLRALEFRAGSVSPAEHRVIVMPMVPGGFCRDQAREPAAVVPIRLDAGKRSLTARVVWYAVALGMAGTVLFAYLYRGEIIESRANVRPPARAAQF